MTSAIRPFRIDVGDDVLADLKSRLQRTRWPDAELVSDWSQGVPLKVIEPLVHPAARGGDPADAFHVVCPSLPGFGFSAKPQMTGWGVDRIAATWATLMDHLGCARYGAQGGDWGSAVTTSLGAQDDKHCVAGIHITLAFNAAPKVEGEPTAEEKRALAGLKHYVDLDSGYSKQQSTRPQTLGYGLTDSPAGQAAWILEKFWAWTDCDGHPERIFNRDDLLDNVMLYWVTGTARRIICAARSPSPCSIG